MCQRKELFCFTAFTRKKKDGGIRTILNLKQLNKHWNPYQIFSKNHSAKLMDSQCGFERYFLHQTYS